MNFSFKNYLLNEATIKLGTTKDGLDRVDKFIEDYYSISKPHPWDNNVRIIDNSVKIELNKFGSSIHISDIQSIKPKSGAGTKAVKKLLKLADKHNVKIDGTAKAYSDDPKYITDTKKLAEWYKKLGFKIKKNYDDSYEIEYN